jgi:hypothetical protein
MREFGEAISDSYSRLANKLEDAIDAVNYARLIRDGEDIEDFRDLDLILAELRSMYERASTTRAAGEPRK